MNRRILAIAAALLLSSCDQYTEATPESLAKGEEMCAGNDGVERYQVMQQITWMKVTVVCKNGVKYDYSPEGGGRDENLY
jgi:hypothetical protein